MPKKVVVVLSNPISPDREDDFNDWYTKAHLPDVLAIDGMVASTRYRLSEAQSLPGPAPYRYLALHEIADEVEVDAVVAGLREARIAGRAGVHDSYDNSQLFCWYFEPIGERITLEAAVEMRSHPDYSRLKAEERPVTELPHSGGARP